MSTPQNRALCCVCGNLRLISDKYHRYDDNYSDDANRHPLGWRVTNTLKCSVCKERTRHAVLRDNCPARFRDVAETRQHLELGAGHPPFTREFLFGDESHTD